jgi:hypothetical protein
MDNSISKIKQHFDINLAECMEELNHMKNIIQNKIIQSSKENEKDSEKDEKDSEDDNDDIDIESDNDTESVTTSDYEMSIDRQSFVSDSPEHIRSHCLPSLTEDEYLEFKTEIFELIDEYLKTDIMQMSNPHFHETLVNDITTIFYSQIENTDICDVDDIDHLEKMVQSICHEYFAMGILPPRSYKNKKFQCISKINTSSERTEEERMWISRQIDYLKSIPQPSQKTTEWYEYRWQILTASNIWKAFGSESQVNSLIYEKCKPLEINAHSYSSTTSTLHWGIKFEPVSVAVYEDMVKKTDGYETKVGDFGCIRHPTYTFIGASPDGINVYEKSSRYGRMIEIKNVVNREITGIPKEEYWIQMQIQMETCNLEDCDFVETQFHLFETEEEFYHTIPSTPSGIEEETEELKLDSNTATPIPIPVKKCLYKGIILYFIRKILDLSNIDNSPHYVYMPLHLQEKSDIDRWIAEQKQILQKEFTLFEIQYWYLETFSCVYVKRNKEWFAAAVPKLQEIWSIIEKERQSGYSHRLPKKKMNSKIEVIHENDEYTHINGMPTSKSICLIKLDSLEDTVVDNSEEYLYENAE